MVDRLLFAIMLSFAFFSCTKNDVPTYIDGKYSAVPTIKDDWGGSAKVELVVKDGKIVSCTFDSYDKDGKLKDADYGKIDGEIKNIGIYKIAQNAMTQAAKYPDMLIQSQNIEELDALSGATVSFRLFEDAVKQIIEKAQKKDDTSSKKETETTKKNDKTNARYNTYNAKKEEEKKCKHCNGFKL